MLNLKLFWYSRVLRRKPMGIIPEVVPPRRDPEIATPMAISLSEISIAKLASMYVFFNVVISLLLGAAFELLRNDRSDLSANFRLAFSSLWTFADPLGVAGQSTGYYVLGVATEIIAIFLPVLLLGSFIFKLFQHNPIRWRKRISLVDFHRKPTLIFRFYNRTRQPLVNLRIEVVARLVVSKSPQVRRNVRLSQVTFEGDLVDGGTWVYSSPGVPFSVRVALPSSLTAPELAIAQVTKFGRDKPTDWKDLRLMIIVTGTELFTGNSFTSFQQYEASRDIVLGRPEAVDVDDKEFPSKWVGWSNFDQSAPMYLFGYGSIVAKGSIESTLKRELADGEGPIKASLQGYKRVWNVGSGKDSHPERTYIYDDGAEYDGVVAVLGIEESEGQKCHGAVVKISATDFPDLIRRERNYDLRDVSQHVDWVGKPKVCSIYTFVPSKVSISRLAEATEVVINDRYLSSVEAAFSNLGKDSLVDFRRSFQGGLPPFRVVPLTAVYRDRSQLS